MKNKKALLWASAAAFTVAILGGLASRPGPWYEALEKSSLTPPNWAFAPAWTIIYATCVAAGYIAWTNAKTKTARFGIITLFFINSVFNIMWSFAFFSLQRPDWAIAEVIVLWLSVAALIIFLKRQSTLAGFLLVPYLLWVGFAAYLNYKIVVLNGPFG